MTHVDLLRQLPHYLAICAILAVGAVPVQYVLMRLVLRRMPLKPRWMAAALPAQLLFGIFLALALFALAMMPAAALEQFNPAQAGWTSFVYNIPRTNAGDAGLLWVFFLVVSAAEELLFRGLAVALFALLLYWQSALLLAPELRSLPDTHPDAIRLRAWLWFGSGTLANAVISIVFGYVHSGNPHVAPLAVVNVGLAGFALGQLYWTQGNLGGAIALHWFWNALQASFGLPVSGIVLMPAMLGIGAAGAVPGILSGGAFGLEGSVLFTLAIALACGWITWHGLRYALAPRSASPAPAPGSPAAPDPD